VPNPNGHQGTLQPFEPDNLAAARHGLWSDRFISDEIERERESLLALPWVKEPDALLVDEVARLRARIAAVDHDLDERGHFGRNGARTLLDHRTRLNGALLRTLSALGATPAERSKWAARLGRPSLADEIRKVLDGDE
jgi:hypothetical protein